MGNNSELTFKTNSGVLETLVYNNIEVGNGGELIFDTTGGDIVFIVKGDLKIKGELDFEGSNNIFIFLYGTNNEIKTKEKNDPASNSLFIFLMEKSKLDIESNRSIDTFIYGPNATVGLQSGSKAAVTGSIVAGTFSAQGSPSIHYKIPKPDALEAFGEYLTAPQFERWYYSR